MAQGLFREEVLAEKRSNWLGAISFAQPVNSWIMTVIAVVAAVSLGVFLTVGTYTRRSTVLGHLVPSNGLATVLSPATGVVSRVDVSEGDRVVAGQTLAVVTVPRVTVANGDTVEALSLRFRQRQEGLRSAYSSQKTLLSKQAAGLKVQLAAAQNELKQVEIEIETRQNQVRVADETLARLRQLRNGNYVSLMQIKQHESAALEQVSAMQAMQRQVISTRRTMAELVQAAEELTSRGDLLNATFLQDLAALEQEQVEAEAQGALTINAAIAGRVATQISKPGQAVQAGQPLFSVLPNGGKLEAELFVPSRAIGFIERGDKVLLRYQAYPYQKFGHQLGRVARISRSALSPSELGALLGKANDQEPLYRIVVTLSRQKLRAYGRDEVLKPGMLVDADILGERRRLIEWIFEPLYSLREVVVGAQ